MKLTVCPYRLELRHPFRLASGSRNHTDTVLIRLEDGELYGFGEASLPPYLGENVRTVGDFMKSIDTRRLSVDDLAESLQYVDRLAEGNNAAKAAIDLALHDLAAKTVGKTLGEYFNLPRKDIATTLTIGISTPDELRTKLAEAEEFALLKLKLGSDDDKALVQEFRRLTDKPFCADANQGWSGRRPTLDLCRFLAEEGCLFIEQPYRGENTDDAVWLVDRSPIPIIADEAIRRLDDLKNKAYAFSGVNIKLMKSTGLAEALKMIDYARDKKMKVIVGCMAESSCAVTAAAHIAALADYADLDGPLLISNDPWRGIRYRDGNILLPDRPGIGVVLEPDGANAALFG